jgi:hypothetical protein
MPKLVTINNITGSSPYNVYLCDNPMTSCVWIDTVSTLPYSFNVPSLLESQTDYTLKVQDDNGCINYTILT